MLNKIVLNLTLDELEALNLILTKLQETKPSEAEEIDDETDAFKLLETNAFIENLLIKIAKVKLEQNIIKEIPKI